MRPDKIFVRELTLVNDQVKILENEVILAELKNRRI